MQLFLKTDADIDIRSNMSVSEQESLSLDTKIPSVTDKIKSDIPNITECVTISNDKENLTDIDVLEKDGNVLNGNKDIDNSQNENSTDEDSNQGLSNNINVVTGKEEVDEVDSNNENQNNTDVQEVLNTSENSSEEKEDHLENKIKIDDLEIKNDNDTDICHEIEPDLSKSDNPDSNPISNVISELNETMESDSTADKIVENIILKPVLENISSKEQISSSNECDPKQQETKEKNDSEKPHEVESQTEIKEEKSKSDKQDVTDTEFTMRVKNVTEINENVFEKHTSSDDKEHTEHITDNTENITEKLMDNTTLNEILSESKNDEIFDLEEDMDDESIQKTSDDVKNYEVIDIADEKDDECMTFVDDKVYDVDKESEKPEEMVISKNSTCNENNATNTNMENIEEENLGLENKNNDEHLNNENLKDSTSNFVQEDKELDNQSSKEIVPEVTVINNIKEKKPLLYISKLSNTLDILSDDDEEQVLEAVSENKESDEKQCISIEDDDDIMLIDEETPIDTNKSDRLDPPDIDIPQDEQTKDQSTENDSDLTMNVDESNEELPQESKVDNETNEKDEQLDENIGQTEQKPFSPKPLLPVNFLKSCKRNFAEMTREELEEFCVLKIVESVVDRSNLSEMNLQLKAMAQNIEDYKKKTNTLLKQNRDLQVVLKSIQEEQKKNTGQAIAPLKITRSVGMQVLMIETPISRKRPSPSNKFPTNSSNPAKLKSQSAKTLKGPTNSTNDQQIPVPRLVPAVNNAATNNKQLSSSPLATKAQGPNGVRSSPPAIKPEKRSHSKMQQGNSITVDLTDDEPPSKVVPRNIAPPVRLVPQQSLLTSQRPQFVNTVNSPRKVYIPISGSQNPVRPGQTIMLKQVSPHVPRLRGPGAVQKCNSVRMPRIAPKHPAPLPDSTKQYQPPNWKALPPAPELKLSKVENGIVISWKIDGYQEENHEEIASYQLYAYQETTSPPSTSLWKKIGDVKALPLPMACTLTQFMAGYKYYFAVRAVDVRSRLGPFSLPGSILLLNKM